MHAYKPMVMHADFQRVHDSENHCKSTSALRKRRRISSG
jgi:hypothetical protein